jgi:hypothetical protein
MKPFLCVILGVGLVLSVGYGAHDLACYEMVSPTGDYVEHNVGITPELAIANVGLEDEPDPGEFFAVEFIVVDKETEDTVFHEASLISSTLDAGDTIYVTITPWAPEGICCDGGWWGGPFVCYELLGIVSLGTDEDRTNDTVYSEATCLLSHDVGVTDIDLDPPPNIMPDAYEPGTEVIITATVENFGIHAEYNIPVHCSIVDTGADPDTLVYDKTEMINFLDWRGNDSDNPYMCEVVFPPWITPALEVQACVVLMCETELEGDICPDDDAEVVQRNTDPCDAVKEEVELGLGFYLELTTHSVDPEDFSVRFAVPHTAWIKVDVFDVNGRWVKSIANDIFEAGRYSRSWDRRDAQGRKVATGIYLIRMQADGFKAVRKVVIMK